jgi:hypothetical protein
MLQKIQDQIVTRRSWSIHELPSRSSNWIKFQGRSEAAEKLKILQQENAYIKLHTTRIDA